MKNTRTKIHRLIGIRAVIVVLCILVIITAFYALLLMSSGVKSHVIPTGQLTLTIPYSKYQVGETISYEIKNNYNSSVKISYDCPNEPLKVYIFTNNSWVRRHDQALEQDCQNQEKLVSIAPQGKITGDFGPWHNLFARSGKYRVVAFVEYYNRLVYRDIEIVDKPSTVINTKVRTTNTNYQPVTSNSTNNTTVVTISPTTTLLTIPPSDDGGREGND